MDLVEFNKLTQNRRVITAENNLYNSAKLEKYNAVILIAYSLKKEYGVFRAVDILHGIGIEKIKL